MESQSSSDEELTSLLRRSHIGSRSRHNYNFNFENPNSESVHRDALEAALAEHERIREYAVRALQLTEARQAQEKLRLHALQEEERVRLETARAHEECRLRDIENKARQIPKPAPRVPTPPPIEPPKGTPSAPKETPKPTPKVDQPTSTLQHAESKPTPLPTNPFQKPLPTPNSTQQPQPVPNPFKKTEPVPNPFQTTQPLSNPFAKSQPTPNPFQSTPKPPTPVAKPPEPQLTAHAVPKIRIRNADQSHILPGAERYIEIHQALKKLRKFIAEEGKKNLQWKKKVSEMRQGIRMSVGQLTIGKGVNKTQTGKILGILKESLTSVPSVSIDPSMFMVSKPEPKEGATHNGDQLPALLIFLLNQLSKSVIAQFIDEAGVSTAAADPVGILVASVFSQKDLLWRGKPLIDILMAKMRVVCPVLFGLRGSEKTEEGRARLGWKRINGNWIDDQTHNTRMTGLGAGYAAISLRDFSNSQMENPWPPFHYWQTMASIVSTPPDQASPTQYNVLKAMIDRYEGRFLQFYGSAGRAALRVALVDFPGRALDEKNAAVGSLKVLVDKYERDQGLVLR